MADANRLMLRTHPWVVYNSTSFTSFTVDAATKGIGFKFQAESADAITHLGFRYGARAATPPAYTLTLEGVSTSTGTPDGTDVGGGSPTATNFTPPADTTWNGTWQWIALTNSYTPTRGQWLTATIRSGTTDAVNYSTFSYELTNSDTIISFPVGLTLSTTWSNRTNPPPFAYKTASGVVGCPIQGVYTTATASTVGQRKALKFNIPSTWCSTFTILGIRTWPTFTAAGKVPVLGLWNAGGVLQSIALDSDVPRAVNGRMTFVFDESSLSTLSAGTDYYIGFEVADAASSAVAMYGTQFAAAGDRAAYPNGLNNCISTYASSAWTDDTTAIPDVDLIFGDITAPAGGGGGGPLIGGRLVL